MGAWRLAVCPHDGVLGSFLLWADPDDLVLATGGNRELDASESSQDCSSAIAADNDRSKPNVPPSTVRSHAPALMLTMRCRSPRAGRHAEY
jgi:hypothetical protein